ncbi:MAG: hypothetical protein AAF590_02610 [Pseudomonadota bacterium]
MSSSKASKSNANANNLGTTLGGIIVLFINIVGFGGIGFAVGGITGAIWVTLVGVALFALLFAWPSLTSGAEQTGLAKIVLAPFAMIASIALFIPAAMTDFVRNAKAKRDAKMGITAAPEEEPETSAPKQSLFRGRWTDATTLSLFLINAVIALIIAVIMFGFVALTVFAVIATPVFLIGLFLIGLNGSNPELAKLQEDEELIEEMPA